MTDLSARERWQALRNGGGGETVDGVLTLLSGVSTLSGPVRFALGARREARLLVPLPEGLRLRPSVPTPALGIADTHLIERGVRRRFLDVSCRSETLERVFAELCDAVLDRIVSGDRGDAAFARTLEDFRTLLEERAPTVKPLEQVVGLLGELLVLDGLLRRHSTAWASWRGPLGDRHDFRAGNCSMEVKSSLRADSTHVSVNGVMQLEPPVGGTLCLRHLRLEEVVRGRLSVASVSRSVMDLADDPAAVLALLTEVDCPDPTALEWNAHSFELQGEAIYRVDSGFPRVVPSSFADGALPAGVDDLQYRLDLSQAAECRMEPADVASYEEAFLACLCPD